MSSNLCPWCDEQVRFRQLHYDSDGTVGWTEEACAEHVAKLRALEDAELANGTRVGRVERL